MEVITWCKLTEVELETWHLCCWVLVLRKVEIFSLLDVSTSIAKVIETCCLSEDQHPARCREVTYTQVVEVNATGNSLTVIIPAIPVGRLGFGPLYRSLFMTNINRSHKWAGGIVDPWN